MKLVILTEIIAPYRIPVFNELARRDGIDLHVIFMSENDPSLREWRVYSEEIKFSWEVLPSLRRRLGKYNLLVNWGGGRALRGAAPGVILCGGYSYLAAWEARRWAGRRRVPFLVWVESTLSDTRRRHIAVEALKRRFLGSADGLVVPGRSSAEYVRSFGISPERIFVAPNAVDVELFSTGTAAARQDANAWRAKLGLPGRYFLFVGRLVREKGALDLLEAYGRLPAELRRAIGLVFVGDGIARRELEQRAGTIAPGATLFPGFAHREELAAYYALSDMLVFPTHSDTWGLVVNEGMACSLPVIATSVAGCTADLISDGWNGRVVRARDVDQLVAAMRELAENPEMRVEMGRHSRERIEGYTPEACAAGIAAAVMGTKR